MVANNAQQGDDKQRNARFVSAVRNALHHLYDPTTLRKSLLVALFGLELHAHPATALRSFFVEAIHMLNPNAKVPVQSKSWRAHKILLQRFQEQFTQQEVAIDLGLSIRHLRREEMQAIHLLADELWTTHHLAATWPKVAELKPTTQDSGNGNGNENVNGTAIAQMPGWHEEMIWLQESLASEAVEVIDLLQVVLQLIQPLAQSATVQIEFQAAKEPLWVDAQRTTLRQALLNVVSAVIQSTPGGQIVLTTKSEARMAQVNIQAIAPTARPASRLTPQPMAQATGAPAIQISAEVVEALTIAQQLSQLSLGELTVAYPGPVGQVLTVQFGLPLFERIPLLVIDDNSDTLQLLQRYLQHSRYHFIGISDPHQALLAVEKYSPQVIIVDVMLPEVDGWELLGRLRTHPATGTVPIIVCTILPQEQLALALGAAAFMRKPITQPALLAKLDQCLDRFSTEFR